MKSFKSSIQIDSSAENAWNILMDAADANGCKELGSITDRKTIAAYSGQVELGLRPGHCFCRDA
jgi:hypothetical protein